MPIYEYHCAACDAEFESIRPVARADDLMECGACGQPATRRISNFSFKSDTFTAPKLRRRPGASFRSPRLPNAPTLDDAPTRAPSNNPEPPAPEA